MGVAFLFGVIKQNTCKLERVMDVNFVNMLKNPTEFYTLKEGNLWYVNLNFF